MSGRTRVLAIEADPDIATLYHPLFPEAEYAVQRAADLCTLGALTAEPASLPPALCP